MPSDILQRIGSGAWREQHPWSKIDNIVGGSSVAVPERPKMARRVREGDIVRVLGEEMTVMFSGRLVIRARGVGDGLVQIHTDITVGGGYRWVYRR